MPLIINRHGGRVTLPLRRHPHGALPTDEGLPTERSATSNTPVGDGFDPDIEDVMTIKNILKRAGKLPDEIILMIMDEAEYWVCSSAEVDYTTLDLRSLVLRGGQQSEDKFLIRTEPIGMTSWSPNDEGAMREEATPRPIQEEYSHGKLEKYKDEKLESALTNPCRKIVFNIQAKDQGWGDRGSSPGPYVSSNTWFDAGLERFDAKADVAEGTTGASKNSSDIPVSALRPVWPTLGEATDGGQLNSYRHELHPDPAHLIQHNKTAHREMQNHHVEWRYTDDIDPAETAANDLAAVGRGKATGNGEFVRNLKFGDVVSVWGRARYQGWQNFVKNVEIKVYWAV